MVIFVVAGGCGKFFRVDVDDAMDFEAGETSETTDDTMERSTKDGCQQTGHMSTDQLTLRWKLIQTGLVIFLSVKVGVMQMSPVV